MEYEYEVVDAAGRARKGRLEAQSEADLVRRLDDDGLTVLAVRESRPSALPAFRRRLKAGDVTVAFHELATLLQSGVALGDAVLAQSRGSHHPSLVAAFADMVQELGRGESFLGALRKSALPLPEYVYQLVEAGELSGRLPDSLRGAVEQMRYDQRVAADFRGALVYPAILVVAGIAAVLLIFLFVVPQFANLLAEADDLPFLAALVIGSGVWFNENTGLLAVVLAAVGVVAFAAWRDPRVRAKTVDALATAPVIGGWFSQADTAKWASVMAAMLAARIELMDALTLAGRGVRISSRRTLLERAAADVRAGSSLSAALEKQNALTATGYNLIRVGEQSGQLAQMMRALADLYQDLSARRTQRVLALVEPLAILLIGGFVGVIMVGLILAITSVNELV